MTKRNRNLIILAVVALLMIVCCGGPIAWWQSFQWQRGVDQAKFITTSRASDPRIARMYELFPEAEVRFNEGNRAGRRGAFAPIAQTFTLTAKVQNGYELKLYRGIAPRIVAPDGVTVVESAYAVQSPTGQVADLTPEEFDELPDAKGDVEKLKPEIWKRPRLPTKHL